MKTIENAALFYKPTCPFCHKVLSFMEQNGISLDLINILEDGNRDKLIALGGKAQVPCLVIDGKPLYESNDIIAYLKKRIGE